MVRRFDGGRLRCDRAKRRPAGHRVPRRGQAMPSSAAAVNLWVSAIDSSAGVITLSAPVDADQLDRWRRTIEARYGRVDAHGAGRRSG